jgi:hypothetical protein
MNVSHDDDDAMDTSSTHGGVGKHYSHTHTNKREDKKWGKMGV